MSHLKNYLHKHELSTLEFGLRLLALVCRIAALLLIVLVVLNAVVTSSERVFLLALNGAVSRLVPSPFAGLFVSQSIFGGIFRGDYLIFAALFLGIDWLFSLAAAGAQRGKAHHGL